MAETRFTVDHEWVQLSGSVATIGITDHAQQALGDVVYVDLPESGRAVEAGQPCAVVESVKAASDVYAPLNGTVTDRNTACWSTTRRWSTASPQEGRVVLQAQAVRLGASSTR